MKIENASAFPEKAPLSKRRFGWLLLLGLLVSGFFYLPSLNNGFVWDDQALVLMDPLIRSPVLIPEGFRQYLFVDATASDFYRPMQRLSYTLDYLVGGFEPAIYHAGNGLIHLAAAFLFGLLTRRVMEAGGVAGSRRCDSGAILAAALWAVHPLHTSAVTYVAGRADPLAAMFGFAALLLLPVKKQKGFLPWLLFWLALLFAGLSKEAGLIFCLLAPLWAWMLRGKRPALLKTGAAAFLAVCTVLLLRLQAEHFAPPETEGNPRSLVETGIGFMSAAGFYFSQWLAPLRLQMEWEAAADWVRRPWRVALGGLAVLAWVGAAVYAGRKRDRILVGLLAAFALTWLPVSGLFPLNAAVAEHWFYTPSAFLLATCTLLLLRTIPDRRAPCIGLLVLGLGLWSFWGVRTWLRQDDWSDQRQFLESTIQEGGDSARMWVNLANLEMREGNPEAARAALGEALERSPDLEFAKLSLAAWHLRRREFEPALVLLAEVEENPFFQVQVLEQRAVAEHLLTKRDTGHLLLQALEIQPENWNIRSRLVRLRMEQGQQKEAARLLREHLELRPWQGAAWEMLGDLYFKAGENAAALECWQEAAWLDLRAEGLREKLKKTGVP